MIYAAILAGGCGSRMKAAKMPKQFLEIGGEPILRLAVDKFLACPAVDGVAVAVPEAWKSHAADLLKGPEYERTLLCAGGASRQESLLNACRAMQETWDAEREDVVLSHDAARPFVSLRCIEECIEAMERFRAVDVVLPASDTIVETDDGERVSRVRERARMRRGQTPQCFRLGDWMDACAALGAEKLAAATDAAGLLLESGIEVGLVAGDEFNFKITTEWDLRIADCLLGARRA